MGRPTLLPGGETIDSTDLTKSKGVFAREPGATVKYARNDGAGGGDFLETTARIFLQISDAERELFINSVPPESKELAKVLCNAGTGGSGGTGFIDFILTDVSEPFQERVQVVQTLSDNFVVYAFGQAAPQFQYSGWLLNTYQDDQRVWMHRLYQDVLRASQLARRQHLAYLRYDSVIVAGVFVAHQQTISSAWKDGVQFAFSLIPTSYTIFTDVGGPPTRLNSANTPGDTTGNSGVVIPDTTQQKLAVPAPVDPAVTRSADVPSTPQLTTNPNLLTPEALNAVIVATAEANLAALRAATQSPAGALRARVAPTVPPDTSATVVRSGYF